MTDEITSRMGSVLLLVLALLLVQPYCISFREWFCHRWHIMKRCQYRRDALRTNLRLYNRTGDDYYIDRVRELGRGK
ncbi:MAG: hypothetical protein IKG98_11495 [Ruminococcus sp.]|nr:hypothetical protein [Ruminococcus sp.]